MLLAIIRRCRVAGLICRFLQPQQVASGFLATALLLLQFLLILLILMAGVLSAEQVYFYFHTPCFLLIDISYSRL